MAGRIRLQDIRPGPRNLALIPIEDPDGEADTEPDGIVGSNPLVLDLRRDVPPGVGPGEVDVRPRLLPRGLGGANVRAILHHLPIEVGPRVGHIPVAEFTDDVKVLRDAVLAADRPQGDLRRAHRLSRIRGVPLEGEPLDLDTQEFQVGDIALLRPEALDALQLVQRLQVPLGEGEGIPRDQDVRERLLHLEDGLPLQVGQLVSGDPCRRSRAVEPPLALAA